MKDQFTAVMPISAYPFHLGHVALFTRAEALFGQGKVLILVCNNSSKSYSAYDRMEFFRSNAAVYPAALCEGLVADYCEKHGIRFIVRGIRNARDFDYENEISKFNEMFGLQTLLIPSPSGMEQYSSTTIRELLKYGKIEQATPMCYPGFEKYLTKLAKELMK